MKSEDGEKERGATATQKEQEHTVRFKRTASETRKRVDRTWTRRTRLTHSDELAGRSWFYDVRPVRKTANTTV